MSCPYCREAWFWKKIGRCQRCMNQLMVLVVISWIIWLSGLISTPSSIEGITFIFACIAVHILLSLHLIMKWIILPLQGRNKYR